MWRKHWMLGLALLAIGMAGCGKSGGTAGDEAVSTAVSGPNGSVSQPGSGTSATSEAAIPDEPAAVVSCFLEAVRTGNDDKANKLLSSVARQKTAEMNLRVMPAASDTAKFQMGKVEYVNADGTLAATPDANTTGARVAADWTDLGEDGKPRTDHALWVVRHEAEGWRVCGLAAMVFPNEEPLLLNFEDPKEMMKKLEWLREEMARRDQPDSPEARTGKNSKDSIRR
jgi:hypothetical protein